MKKLSAEEISEIVRLHQQASADLSYVRTYFHDPASISHLSRLVSRSASMLYGARQKTWHSAAVFATVTFPVAVWRARRFVAAAAAFFLIPALVTGIWIAGSPEARDVAMPDEVRQAYLEHDFEDYYESENASQFAATVYTNNVQVAIGAFAFGALLCVPTIGILVFNGLSVGVAGGMFAAYGQQAKFWGLIMPHGLLEITAVLIAGGAGLQLGWAIISPGDRSRRDALATVGRRAVVVVLGLFFTFGAAGLIEGFVTGQPWPTWLRLGIGIVTWLSFCTYVVVLGRRAERLGYDGTLDETSESNWVRRSNAA